jgi:L,D-peptidoglycan transpeptidase YkuD (ErfK/YbiS/YcfS/YnhG family)
MSWSMAVFFGAWMLACCLTARAGASDLALDAKQIIVCIAPKASSSEGTLQFFHRDAKGEWQVDAKPWPVMLGRTGLAWGRGLNPEQPGPQKIGGDGKSPEGLFKIGPVFGYAPELPEGAKNWPYHQVTDRDAWIDDPALAGLGYNHLYTLPKDAPYPPWWQKEYMHLGDFAYEWLVLIEHNYDDPDMKSGNEIYFHIRRGEHYRTSGCTTMERDRLEQLVKWLDPAADPMVATLTRADYDRVWKDWHLPAPELIVTK